MLICINFLLFSTSSDSIKRTHEAQNFCVLRWNKLCHNVYLPREWRFFWFLNEFFPSSESVVELPKSILRKILAKCRLKIWLKYKWNFTEAESMTLYRNGLVFAWLSCENWEETEKILTVDSRFLFISGINFKSVFNAATLSPWRINWLLLSLLRLVLKSCHSSASLLFFLFLKFFLHS